MLVREYLNKYKEIEIKTEDKYFYSNGKDLIIGKFKAKDFKRIGML